MKQILNCLLLLPFVLLTSCSKEEPSLSVEEFQKVTDNLEDHRYSTCSVNRHTVTNYFYNSEDYHYTDERDGEAKYHFDDTTNDWAIDDGNMILIDAYKPQTLHGADIDGMLDRRYTYTFYNNPVRVHMHRTFEESGTSGYVTFDWKYDRYGYLIYIHSYRYDKYLDAENDYRIIEVTFNYVYK